LPFNIHLQTSALEIVKVQKEAARADYFEVLMTQRDALESKLELIETKKAQLNAAVHVYRDLGGGWK
jgi:outer membrane protein TolC